MNVKDVAAELLLAFRKEQSKVVGKGCLCSSCEEAMERAILVVRHKIKYKATFS